MTRSVIILIATVLFCTCFSLHSVSAQTARPGRLIITVADQTGAVIPNATVTIAGEEAATKSATVAPAQTTEQGVATLAGLPPGRYTIQAEFTGFETAILKDVRVRTGDNKQVLVLPIQKLTDSVTVGQDPQTAASDPRGRTFGSALTREQIDALSDDPNVARQQLQEIAGGAGVVIRVDGFEGAPLPPKAQIKSIHVTRDAFAAENHSAGGIFVEIITQPGIGALRVQGQFRFRDGSMSGQSPFNQTKGPERTQQYGINLGGTIIKDKSSFSLSVNGNSSYESTDLNVALAGGARRTEALNIRQPNESLNVQGLFDLAITRDQTLRVSFSRNAFSNENQGIGSFNLPERGFSTSNRQYSVRVQEAGPLGRRFFINTRVSINWLRNDRESVLEERTIRVNDAFTSGGAQVAGERTATAFNVASDLDYVRGIHSVRTGISIEGGRNQSNLTDNYLGTYTFESLELYELGIPRSYTRRIGDPNILYADVRGAFYIQDDIRVRRNLTLSPGVRYELQTHISQFTNIGPRFGMTWAPFKSGRTTLRASTGIFNDWMNQGTYEQVQRVDGFRQQELNILNPGFPEPGSLGTVFPVSRYLLDPDLRLPRTVRLNSGIEQAFSPRLRVGLQYTYMRGTGLWRGLNLNAPVNGVRPTPTFGNIVQVVSDASSRQHTINVNFNAGQLPPPLLPSTAKRIDWKRVFVLGNYNFARLRNNTDGEFTPPPSGLLDTEWGAANGDIRHRANFQIINQVLKSFTWQMGFNIISAPPYTVQTGRDDNADFFFNDRPAGVGRNTERGSGQFTINTQLGYMIQVGKRGGQLPPGIRITAIGGGAPTVETFNIEQAKFRIQFIVQILNLTNHYNYAGYSGVLTSEFFGQPRSVINPRKIDMGVQFMF